MTMTGKTRLVSIEIVILIKSPLTETMMSIEAKTPNCLSLTTGSPISSAWESLRYLRSSKELAHLEFAITYVLNKITHISNYIKLLTSIFFFMIYNFYFNNFLIISLFRVYLGKTCL